MSESLGNSIDPYKSVFEDIERTSNVTTMDAYRTYNIFVEQMGYDPSIYLSMAITSGGYARDRNLSFTEALKLNTGYGAVLSDIVERQYSNWGIQKSDIIVPSALGKVDGWSQADYLLFWAHVITGLDPTIAQMIDDRVRDADIIGSSGFIDKSIDREDRWLHYKSLIDEYVNGIDDIPYPIHPRNIQAVILILDAEESLGVNAERHLCHMLGIGEYVFGVDKSLGLKNHSKAVKRLGATTLSQGSGDISGCHNMQNSLNRRARGQFWRKSGILSGIVDRRETASMHADSSVPIQTSAELWKEYFANK